MVDRLHTVVRQCVPLIHLICSARIGDRSIATGCNTTCCPTQFHSTGIFSIRGGLDVWILPPWFRFPSMAGTAAMGPGRTSTVDSPGSAAICSGDGAAVRYHPQDSRGRSNICGFFYERCPNLLVFGQANLFGNLFGVCEEVCALLPAMLKHCNNFCAGLN